LSRRYLTQSRKDAEKREERREKREERREKGLSLRLCGFA
jgi:hypothetical protein